MIALLKAIYLTNRFFIVFGVLAFLFVVSFALSFLFLFVQILFFLTLILLITDSIILFGNKKVLSVKRILPNFFSLSDPNPVVIQLENLLNTSWFIRIVDELPVQFQTRDFEMKDQISGFEKRELRYTINPKERGEYCFGKMNLYLSTRIGLIERRNTAEIEPVCIPVYPSVIQMKQYELMTMQQIATQQGIKRIRRIGHSYEFEQIKNYVQGDDIRSINWKASGRRAELMVNQYEDERAQQVYTIIDKSRAMRMPFEGLSLMDYAINTSLAISNIILKKHDRAGLITFSDKMGGIVKADNKPLQLNKILNALYKEEERPLEANYELLYYASRRLISGRSLLLLFTNFESSFALERVLPILRKVNNFHLLVVVFFENTEILKVSEQTDETVQDIYLQTVAEKFLAEKNQMVSKLKQYGIQAILTKPEDLSLNTINKYLELKSRGLI